MSEKNKQIEKILDNFQSIKRTLASEGYMMNKDFGITMTQASVLFMLKKKGEMNLTEIANILGVSKSAATQLVDGLESHGFLVREQDGLDKRVSHIKPSEKGALLLQKIRKNIFDRISVVFEALEESELDQLEKITTKLTKVKEGNPECQN